MVGKVKLDASWSEHSAGPALRPCYDSVRSGRTQRYDFPSTDGTISVGSHHIELVGNTAIPIRQPGPHDADVAIQVDGRNYVVMGSITLRSDGSASGTLRGQESGEDPSLPTVAANVSWTCRDGLLPFG
jgi:hypothetical protein